MAEPKDGSPQKEPLRTSEDFLERIRRASGELIPLQGKKSKLGESFYVCTRWGESDFLKHEADNLLIVDMFALRDGQFVPIGHYDWLVKNGDCIR